MHSTNIFSYLCIGYLYVMNSTLKIILAFKLKFLLIIVSIASSFLIEGALSRETPVEVISNPSTISNDVTNESVSYKALNKLSDMGDSGRDDSTDRFVFEIIL